MAKFGSFFIVAFFLASIFPAPLVSIRAPINQASKAGLLLLDRNGNPTTILTDGDRLRLQVSLPNITQGETRVEFRLGPDATAVAGCNIPAGKDRCESPAFTSLGWYWLPPGEATAQNRAAAGRTLGAYIDDQKLAELAITVAPRPVVMVHGFSSSWQAWVNYLGPGGFLAQVGLRGFAVGDGQVEGALNTGNLAEPANRTNTIAQNAEIVGQYIARVRQLTGAQQVDLLAHSMGGLISRYYIAKVMQERDVAQLIMLGSPMAGTECSNLPASLGFYLPASLEIRPSYVTGIFNAQVTQRKGVPFNALAGIPIVDPLQSPCTQVPTDIAVSLGSVSAIPLNLEQLPVLHTDLNASSQVFADYVLPRLQTPAGQFQDEPDPPPAGASPVEPLQFTRVYTGHVTAGESQEVTIPIDANISVANFALFDPTRSLTVTVQGANGNTIVLDPVRNGLVLVDDLTTLVYLGYGFSNPRPGLWKVILSPTSRTPLAGASFAITARFSGGAVLQATASQLLPRSNERIHLAARLDLAGQALPLSTASAAIRGPDGGQAQIQFTIEGDTATAEWQPGQTGLYAIDIIAQAKAPDGAPVERAAFLAIEAQPELRPVRVYTILGILICGLLILATAMIALLVWIARRRRRKAAQK